MGVPRVLQGKGLMSMGSCCSARQFLAFFIPPLAVIAEAAVGVGVAVGEKRSLP